VGRMVCSSKRSELVFIVQEVDNENYGVTEQRSDVLNNVLNMH